MIARAALEEKIDALIDEQRVRCLWFLRPDWYPTDDVERMRTLDQIQRHADRATFARAAELKRWLSQSSKDASAGS